MMLLTELVITAVNLNEVELFILRVCINDKQMLCALFDFLQHRHSSMCL
jgi:hypothetical protein